MGKKTQKNTEDLVNHPSHYTHGTVECIDAMEDIFGPNSVYQYCVINAYKYIWRCHDKGAMKQDLNKAIWYLNHACDILKRNYSDLADYFSDSSLEDRDYIYDTIVTMYSEHVTSAYEMNADMYLTLVLWIITENHVYIMDIGLDHQNHSVYATKGIWALERSIFFLTKAVELL